MKYQEMRDALKPYIAAGESTISLNATKPELAAELERCEQLIQTAVDTIEEGIAAVETEVIAIANSPVATFIKHSFIAAAIVLFILARLAIHAGRVFRQLADEAYANGQFVGEWYYSEGGDRIRSVFRLVCAPFAGRAGEFSAQLIGGQINW